MLLRGRTMLLWTFTCFCCCGYSQKEDSLTLIIMRHGQAQHNYEDIYNSNPSHPKYKPSFLTPFGEEQARATGEKLLAEGISNVQGIYVSPLPRTMQSAIILCRLGLGSLDQIREDKRLIELQAGDLEGLPIIHDWKPSYAEKYHFEMEEKLAERVTEFCKDLFSRHFSGIVIVVTHRLVAQMLFSLVSGSPQNLAQGEAGIIVLPPEKVSKLRLYFQHG